MKDKLIPVYCCLKVSLKLDVYDAKSMPNTNDSRVTYSI